ncbi:hypothetical protein BJ875DRAFT_23569 [Amylocarpus encephaloides]|uniref:Transaldolase n=1 Tax=Amylocarpus encephaloides TaxID=45428 RepID=A0A9P7YRS8_9HELO|nr:hypothetical protein BJ875DRAFT_23569 [Amylocarpus encephaloides]
MSSNPPTMLQLLQRKTIVDCDTMDVEVPKTLGPFADCTSNQAIAYGELSKPENKALIQESVAAAEKYSRDFVTEVFSIRELAGEIAMIKLQLRIAPYVTGFVHIQTNPVHSYNTPKTIENAKRIIALFKLLDPSFDSKRVCIKIPSSWEGLRAILILKGDFQITTLATTLFVPEQYALAGEVGAHYIAPYVNELRVHFDTSFEDTSKAFRLCLEAQRYYEAYGLKTRVLPASLTSTEEVMMLKGVHHITVSPPLLRGLAGMDAGENRPVSVFEREPEGFEVCEKREFGDDEEGWKSAFRGSAGGEGVRKLDDAIGIFTEMQVNMEKLMDPTPIS